MTYLHSPPEDHALSQAVDEHGMVAPANALATAAESELSRIYTGQPLNPEFRRGLGNDGTRTLFVGLDSNWDQWLNITENDALAYEIEASRDSGFSGRMDRLGVHVGNGPRVHDGSWMHINWADLGRCLTNAAFAALAPSEPRLNRTAQRPIRALRESGTFWDNSAGDAMSQQAMPLGVLESKNGELLGGGGNSARFLADAQRLSSGVHRPFNQIGSLVSLNEEVLLLRHRMRARGHGRAVPAGLAASHPALPAYNYGLNVLEEVRHLLTTAVPAHEFFAGLNAISAWHMSRSDLGSAKVGMHWMNILAVRASARGVRWMAVNDLNLILSSNLPLLTALVPLVEHDILQLRFLENTHFP